MYFFRDLIVLFKYTFWYSRTGCVQVGDRILSVNGCKSTSFVPLFQQPLHDFLGPEVKNACIKVEFDITDSVVPTSGEFTVKLLKNDYRSLGITITGKHHERVYYVH